jgi:hypothetical protein
MRLEEHFAYTVPFDNNPRFIANQIVLQNSGNFIGFP